MNKDFFIIRDIDNFTNYSRVLVYNLFGNKDNKSPNLLIKNLDSLSSEDKKELDTILSFNESLVIIKSISKKQINKKTKEIRYVISDELYMSMLEALNDRMTSNLLRGLVNRGLIETGYDNEIDDFVFWVKDDENKT